MENNFFVGVVYHSRRAFKAEYKEKIVLYSENYKEFIDLRNGQLYTLDERKKDYILDNTLIPTDVREYRDDYLYLLYKYKNGDHVQNRRIKLKSNKINI